MIYEMICNETGERFITFTEVYQEPLNIKNRIRINKHRFSKSEKGENTYSFNLLENCFDEIGIVPFPLFTERKKFHLQL